MAANMAAISKMAAGEKLNLRISTQFFFYNILSASGVQFLTLFFKMATDMAAIFKMATGGK